MSNLIVKMLDPEQWYLVEDYCKANDLPVPLTEWAQVFGAIDVDLGKLVGMVCIQMLTHTEPIMVDKEYQGKGVVDVLTKEAEGFLEMIAHNTGKPIQVYNQPTNAAAERICRTHGYSKAEHPLYVKIYKGDMFKEVLEGDRLWQQQYQPLSESEPQS